jgi:RNase H-like domain found in reverse transcriptase/Reverse transcriptase (RNA-dependent DNA polymerase)/Integrase zinc binding domain/Integrase core domain
VKMLIDSGAEVCTLSESDWASILEEYVEGKRVLENLKWGADRQTLTAYAAAKPLQIEASFTATIQAGTRSAVAKIFAIKGAKKSLLSRTAALTLGVLKLGLELNECELKPQDCGKAEVFPHIPGELVHFDVNPTVPPTKNAYYNVPAAFRARARARLDEMEDQQIIEGVYTAPRWISGMSLVPKGKTDFRLVVNMRGPNRAILRAYYPLPTIDEMRVRLAGAKFFSKLDIKSAFYHLMLDEASRELTTFQTERGMRRFTRLMFGVNCAPEIFQRMMESKLCGIEGVIVFIDDVLIFAGDLHTLGERTGAVIQALRLNNLTINEEKSEHARTKITFLGHELSSDGFAIDNDKVKAVREFKRPTNPTDLRSFLGLVSYLSDYVPRFADLVAPMWNVVKKTPFEWTEAAANSFENSKATIAATTESLSFFSESWSTILYTDASPYALGAVLVQENQGEKPRTICFVSKALTETEKNYPQVQREALAIVWSVERLFYYLLGRRFTIRTDARGLAFIFDRDKVACKRAMNRAEGWALRLSTYDYHIEWIKGSENIADPPSRLCITHAPFKHEVRTPGAICELSELTQELAGLSTEVIRRVYLEDQEAQSLLTALRTGTWTPALKRYETIESELRVSNGVAIRLGAVVIPKPLREKALRAAHSGHPGKSAMKSILRQHVWWPGMPTDAEKWVENCEGCNLAARPEKPVPMRVTRLPEEPWEKLAIDHNGPHAAYQGRYVLVLVDYFSRFLVAVFVNSTSMECTAGALTPILNWLGNPKSIRADNGPPFGSRDWAEYCEARGIIPEHSTPGHPQQNGLAERYMGIVNKAVTVAITTGEDPERSLEKAVNAHNSAAQRTTGVAPEVLLFGRVRRGALPTEGPTTRTINREELEERDESEKERYRQRENLKRGAKHSKISIGDQVLLKRHAKAKDQTTFAPKRYTVVSGEMGDFTIKANDGQTLTRNVTQLKRVAQREEPCTTNSGESDEQPRQKRARQTPTYLSDYVTNVHE